MKTKLALLEDLLDGHDCHLSSEDSCECVDLTIALVKLKRKALLARGIVELTRPRVVKIVHWSDKQKKYITKSV